MWGDGELTDLTTRNGKSTISKQRFLPEKKIKNFPKQKGGFNLPFTKHIRRQENGFVDVLRQANETHFAKR